MHFLLLILTIILLLFALKNISKIKYSTEDSFTTEAKKNILSLLWGALVIAALILIPYEVWVITGKSPYLDGAIILLGTGLLTAVMSFVYYYKVA
mgnify:CR=1 FL=1